ncbi:MAG: hypothetical protein L6R36_006216 [Xanthoria steineri]|nr:MAG: hypothetical protein L6R36_006216 [Xanthoria steineri]
MSPLPHPTLQNSAPRLLQTIQPHSEILPAIHFTISNTENLTLGILAIIISGSGLAAAILLFRKWRQKTGNLTGDGVFALERREAPKERMRDVMGGWQKGVGSTCEGDRGGDPCEGWRSEEFEGEDGLGIHFVDVE